MVVPAETRGLPGSRGEGTPDAPPPSWPGRTLDDIELSARPVTQASLNKDTIDHYAGLGVTLLIADTSFEHDSLQGALDEVTRLADQLMPYAD